VTSKRRLGIDGLFDDGFIDRCTSTSMRDRDLLLGISIADSRSRQKWTVAHAKKLVRASIAELITAEKNRYLLMSGPEAQWAAVSSSVPVSP
jgi:hypothetical protein